MRNYNDLVPEPLTEPLRGKLYVLVRADLAPGYQMAQALHAAVEFSCRHCLDRPFRHWHSTSNTVVILAVHDEGSLHFWMRSLQDEGRSFTVFQEPDLLDACTALACLVQPWEQSPFDSLPLALSSGSRHHWWQRR